MSTKISKGSIIASFIYEKSTNLEGYEEMDLLTINEVKKNDGYLGHELFNTSKKKIFISYWKDIKSIEKWKNNSLHIKAKKMEPVWYKTYKIQISELKNDYNLDQL
jgi:heme-degrading monooxygenase HmoA